MKCENCGPKEGESAIGDKNKKGSFEKLLKPEI